MTFQMHFSRIKITPEILRNHIWLGIFGEVKWCVKKSDTDKSTANYFVVPFFPKGAICPPLLF